MTNSSPQDNIYHTANPKTYQFIKEMQVYLKNTNEANQLESVLKQFTANRYELAQLLQSCWEVS